MSYEEQILEVLTTIKMLDPTVATRFTDEQLLTYVKIANAVVSQIEGIPSEKIVLALSLKTLSLISLPENSSLSSKKIKDVTITYYQGQGKSKWDTLFDSLVSGQEISDKTLEYVGI